MRHDQPHRPRPCSPGTSLWFNDGVWRRLKAWVRRHKTVFVPALTTFLALLFVPAAFEFILRIHTGVAAAFWIMAAALVVSFVAAVIVAWRATWLVRRARSSWQDEAEVGPMPATLVVMTASETEHFWQFESQAPERPGTARRVLKRHTPRSVLLIGTGATTEADIVTKLDSLSREMKRAGELPTQPEFTPVEGGASEVNLDQYRAFLGDFLDRDGNAEVASSEIVVNVTGGTVPMSLGAYEVARERGLRVECFYVDRATGKATITQLT